MGHGRQNEDPDVIGHGRSKRFSAPPKYLEVGKSFAPCSHPDHAPHVHGSSSRVGAARAKLVSHPISFIIRHHSFSVANLARDFARFCLAIRPYLHIGSYRFHIVSVGRALAGAR